MAIVKEFEQVYTDSKTEFNEFDNIQLTTESRIKVLKQAFHSLKENLFQDYPDFDNLDIEKNIQELII
jgi:hypothetical protein